MVAVMHFPLGLRQGCLSPRGLACAFRPCLCSKLVHMPRTRRGCVRVRAESPIIEEVAGRRINAPVFNRTRWAYHQNTGRYSRHLESIFRSVTFRNLQGPLSVVTLVSCLVVLYRTLVELEQLPDLFEGVRFTDVPFQLTSFALSLLLVFRTDASYSRWCAAMDAWGTLRNSSSHLVRKAAAWVGDTASLQRLVRWVGAFPTVLMVELRYDQGDTELEAAIRREMRGVLRPHEVDQVVAAGPYYHQFCLSVLTALIEAAQLGESREAALLEDLTGFNQAACECEKIFRFPIPLTYTRHTSRFMLIYLTALPLALYDSCDWAVVPVTLVIAFLLLGIEDIGVQIEEPFSILPLPEICSDLRITAQRAITQRAMVRCLADPDTCQFDPEELELGMRSAAAVTSPLQGVGGGVCVGARNGNGDGDGHGDGDGGGNGGSGSRGGGGSNGDALSSKPVSTTGTGRGSYIYDSKGTGLVAALADGASASVASASSASNGGGGGVRAGGAGALAVSVAAHHHHDYRNHR